MLSVFVVGALVVRAAISLSTSTPYTQTFDGIGTSAAASLPADFRVDNPSTVRTVGSYAASTATTRVGGASLSTSAANGVYNFGSGTGTTGSDRAIGFLSSGTATASGNLYAQLQNTTGGSLSGLQISYTVEKYRRGINAAGFRIQLFYSTDGATWSSAGSNFLTQFAADPGTSSADNTGYSPAPGVTVAVSNTLNVPIASGGSFFLAWNYSVASGSTTTNAQALAVDDISIQGITNASTDPTGVASASPSSVQAGTATLLLVTVTPGANPPSTGLAVSGDLSAIGGAASQPFYDDGTHGDVAVGDNIFTFQATVPAATTPGAKMLPISMSDGSVPPRSSTTSISLTVTPASTPAAGTGSATPNNPRVEHATLLTVNVTPGTNPPSTGITVTGDLSPIGGSASQPFYNDGTNGDAIAGDNVFSYAALIPAGTAAGAKALAITIGDAQGRTAAATISLTTQGPPPPTTIKISQVYGGGGNSGATYTNDFIELFNAGTTAVDITGWSVQYSSATSTLWSGGAGGNVTSLCPIGPCILAPGQYFIVREAQGNGGTTQLPAADATGTIAMSGTAAKVALVATTTPLVAAPGGDCPVDDNIVDFVGYGIGANCFEGAPTSSLSNTTAAVRRGNGCVDTDNNANDFVSIVPIPRNSAAPPNFCGGNANTPSGTGIAQPSGVEPAGNVLLSVQVVPAAMPPSTGLVVTVDLTSVGGSASQAMFDDNTHGDAAADDDTFSFLALMPTTIPTGAKYLSATITDAQGRIATAPITLTIVSPTCGVERWAVKVGSDSTVGLVDLVSAPTPATVEMLGLVTPPAETDLDPPSGAFAFTRSSPVETTLYSVDATMTFYKKETDVDYHVVLDDENGHTLIAEIPSPACILADGTPRTLVPSPLAAGIAHARAKFDARLTATGFFQTANIPVRARGVGFFDFAHGQRGVAPNAIELHPLLDLSFRGATTTALASSENPSVYGHTITLTAAVGGGDGTNVPTGNVVFFEGGNSLTAPLDSNGQATFTTNTLIAGTRSITASYEGDDTSVPSMSAAIIEVIAKADQTIDFGALAGKTYGDADFGVSASADSGLPVAFSIDSGPATISGATVHVTGAGIVTVRASQPGDDNHNPAPDVDRSFVVAQTSQTISFGSLPDKTFGDPPFTVAAVGGASGNPVTFSASGSCSPGGANGATISLVGIGVCTVAASQAGTVNYAAAADVSRTFTVFDRTAPAIAAITPGTATLWPPNKRMVPVSLGVSVSDDVDAAPACLIAGVTSNEGSSSDWQVTRPLTLNLRADRAGNGNGRLYVITVRCADRSGNASTATTTVAVPHDRGK